MSTRKSKHLIFGCILAGWLAALLWIWACQPSIGRAETPPALRQVAGQSVALRRSDAASQAIGNACGAGEALPPWTLCLHGAVFYLPDGGTPQAVNGAQVTVTFGERSITGTTCILPGQNQPSYGIDISPLEPVFMQPVTVTAVISGMTVQRAVGLFPNFATQSQQFDLYLRPLQAFDPDALRGAVLDFGAGQAVSDAAVVLQQGRQVLTSTTAPAAGEAYPIYHFTWTELQAAGVAPDSVVTLTAIYSGDRYTRAVRLGQVGAEPVQVILSTGWKCPDFDPIPRGSGGEGFPRGSGGEGFPDLGCFWGYVVLDGKPAAGALVHLQNRQGSYETHSRLYPGEGLPRYAIGLWGRPGIERFNDHRHRGLQRLYRDERRPGGLGRPPEPAP